MTKGMRGGFTLVEVMLAGAIAVLMTLALMEGLIVSAKISHENSELLAADAFAWDTAWKWLNKSYDDLPAQADGRVYDSATDTAMAMTTNDCPVLNFEHAGGDPRVVVRVVMCEGTGAIARHGTNVKVKRIDVDVEWGPAGDRKCLNGLCGSANYSHPVSVYKSQIDRGVLE
ncbi:MAG: hypothetical protein IKF72_08825 [Kiritimatiellae bacterium]|nr:hypothetical protein [Kiritimatiellia bacterium]